MREHVKLIGGPADGRRLVVKGEREQITVAAREAVEPDPSTPRRHRRRRPEGKRNCRYRRTDRGVGTALIPKRYKYAG